jgi:hypothetical protein
MNQYIADGMMRGDDDALQKAKLKYKLMSAPHLGEALK